MRLRAALIAIAMTATASASQAAECMRANEDGEIAEGSLAQWTFEDAAGRPEQAFIVTLAVPTCLAGADETDNVAKATSIHIYSSDASITGSIKELVGTDVQVRGSAFGAHTAHHHAPIVMDISEIDSL